MNPLPSSLKNFICHKFINISPYGIIVFSEELSIIFFSKSAYKITGFKQSEIIGKKLEDVTILELFSKDNEEISFEDFLRNLKKNTSKVLYIRHKSNYRFSVKIRFFLFKEKKKKEKYIIGIFNIFDTLDYTRRLVNSIKRISNHDHLTMLPNRKFLEFLINKKLHEFKRYNSKFGIILFDINNFKSINDNFGHIIGDDILIDFSRTISKNLRNCDILGRWGGDEFIALITNVDEDKIETIMKKLTEIIKNKLFLITAEGLHLTVSAGFSIIRKKDNLQTLVDRADKNMYEDKFKNINP